MHLVRQPTSAELIVSRADAEETLVIVDPRVSRRRLVELARPLLSRVERADLERKLDDQRRGGGVVAFLAAACIGAAGLIGWGGLSATGLLGGGGRVDAQAVESPVGQPVRQFPAEVAEVAAGTAGRQRDSKRAAPAAPPGRVLDPARPPAVRGLKRGTVASQPSAPGRCSQGCAAVREGPPPTPTVAGRPAPTRHGGHGPDAPPVRGVSAAHRQDANKGGPVHGRPERGRRAVEKQPRGRVTVASRGGDAD